MIPLVTTTATVVMSLVLLSQPSMAAEDVWHTNFVEAEKQAEKENKDLLIYFSGSDWCGWCMKLEKEVFTQGSFIQSVADEFVLIKIDFPRRKKLPPEVSLQNTKLNKRYKPTKFPNVILCDSLGRPYAKTYYRKGGVEVYVKHLTELQEKKKNRNASLAIAGSMEGIEKARTLEHALSFVPRSALPFYEPEINAIAKADPDDVSGFHIRYQIQRITDELRQIANPMFGKRNFAGVCKEVDEYIQQHNLKDEPLQAALMFKLSAQYLGKDYNEALKTAEAIINTSDVTRSGRYAAMVKKRITRLRNEE